MSTVYGHGRPSWGTAGVSNNLTLLGVLGGLLSPNTLGW